MAATASDSDVNILRLLNEEHRLPAELRQLDRGELESLRSAVEQALALQFERVIRESSPRSDSGFSCEWWPPN